MDRTKADGLRLDAVKHVRADFFGAGYGSDKDYNDYGYLGQAQRQFNLTRGFNDSRFNSSPQGSNVNLRESVFDTEKPRHNAMMFGEHLGEPPPYGDYFNVGMRLVDNVLRNNLNDILGNPSANLNGLDSDGGYGFASSLAVMHAQSHDNDYSTDRDLQHGLYFTRAGIGLIYTDGNHQAQTLGQSGGAFPRHANTNYLGQFADPKIPNLLYIHNQFARGYQVGRYSDADFVAYERIDKRENTSMTDADGATLLYPHERQLRRGPEPQRLDHQLRAHAVRRRRLSLQLLDLRRRLLHLRQRHRERHDHRPARRLFRLFLAQPGGIEPLVVRRRQADHDSARRPADRHPHLPAQRRAGRRPEL